MRLKSGNYTVVKGIEFELFESRYEVPIPDEEKEYSICTYNSSNLSNDFYKLGNEGKYCKPILQHEIECAYYVKTKGLINGYEVLLICSFIDEVFHYSAFTDNPKTAIGLNMIEINTSWFTKKIDLNDCTKIWEERIESQFGFRFPTDFERIIEIELPRKEN